MSNNQKFITFIVYSNSRYYQIESCRLEWIDCRPSLYHLQLNGNCNINSSSSLYLVKLCYLLLRLFL